MHVVYFIRNNSVEQLKELYDIKVREYHDRMVLNYGIKSPKFDPITIECRALILSKDLQVISRSFDRFFNYGETPESLKFPIQDSIAMEKIDGSLMVVANDGSQWNVQTRSMAFAEGPTTLEDLTFKDVFLRAIGSLDIFKDEDPELIFVFEFVSPVTKVIKSYGEYAAYLLSVRNKHGYEYIEEDYLAEVVSRLSKKGAKVRLPKVYRFKTLEDILLASKELPELEEGYVCSVRVDGSNVWRIKIKNPAYVAASSLRANGQISTKSIVSLVMNNDYDEYLTIFPEDREFFDPYILAYARVEERARELIRAVGTYPRKAFALEVVKTGLGPILFPMYDGSTFEEAITRLSMDSIVRLINNFKI